VRSLDAGMDASAIECTRTRDGVRSWCIGCGIDADLTMRFESGRLARLCLDCLSRYSRPCVYFIVGAGLVKVGYARDVLSRFDQLQIASPVRLRLWHVVEGGNSLERELHERFAPDREHGEWFRISDDIHFFVEGISGR
jgi:hypothetical protein